MRPAPMLPQRLQRILAVVVALGELLVVVLGTLTFVHGRALAARGVVTTAQLTFVGHREQDSETGHQVNYRFRVGARDYQHVGVFGGPVSTDVDGATQAAAIATGAIAVRYLPDEPRVNNAAGAPGAAGGRGLIAVAIGLAMLLAAGARFAMNRSPCAT